MITFSVFISVSVAVSRRPAKCAELRLSRNNHKLTGRFSGSLFLISLIQQVGNEPPASQFDINARTNGNTGTFVIHRVVEIGAQEIVWIALMNLIELLFLSYHSKCWKRKTRTETEANRKWGARELYTVEYWFTNEALYTASNSSEIDEPTVAI